MTAAPKKVEVKKPARLTLVSSSPKTSERAKTAPDEDLWRAARDGDTRAFAALFDMHSGRVRAMCTRMLRNRADIDDAVQQTFLEAWRCLHRFRGRSLFSTWITRIAIHTCLGFRRKMKRIVFTDDDMESRVVRTAFSSGVAQPDECSEENAVRAAVDEVLASLTKKKRATYVLCELEGMSAREAAAILSIPEATVRTRLFHARKDFMKEARSHPVFQERAFGKECS